MLLWQVCLAQFLCCNARICLAEFCCCCCSYPLIVPSVTWGFRNSPQVQPIFCLPSSCHLQLLSCTTIKSGSRLHDVNRSLLLILFNQKMRLMRRRHCSKFVFPNFFVLRRVGSSRRISLLYLVCLTKFVCWDDFRLSPLRPPKNNKSPSPKASPQASCNAQVSVAQFCR